MLNNSSEIMGARTDHRKRPNDFFSLIHSKLVLCGSRVGSEVLPLSSDVEIPGNLPSAKRLRIISPESVSHSISKPPSESMPNSASRFTRYPPPFPLRRAVQGPQRISKLTANRILSIESSKPSFGVTSASEREETTGGMGNCLAKIQEHEVCLQEENKDVVDFTYGSREGKPTTGDGGVCSKDAQNDSGKRVDLGPSTSKGTTHEGISIEAYRRMIDKQEGRSMDSDPQSCETSVGFYVSKQFANLPDSHFEPSSSLVSGLTTLSRKTDEGKKIDSPSTNHVDNRGLHVRRPPLYRELHESSKKRDSKLTSLNFEVKYAEEKLAALKFISLGRIKEAEEDAIHKPFIALTDEEEVDVERALHGPNRREILVTHENSNIEITRNILQCLSPGAWLNDEVINLYLELLKERERRDPDCFLRCHFFNTFFYKKLISGRNGYDFKAVRRWTTQKKIGYGLIECDKIFVPIHKEIHWCLAVINLKDKKFQYLDSLKGMDTRVLTVLAKYITDEAKDKSDKDINVSSWAQEFVDDLPEQENGWDCGMFMIKYADFYSRGLSLSFHQDHMPYFRKRTVKEILQLRADP